MIGTTVINQARKGRHSIATSVRAWIMKGKNFEARTGRHATAIAPSALKVA
jgi:hypothetical protein